MSDDDLLDDDTATSRPPGRTPVEAVAVQEPTRTLKPGAITTSLAALRGVDDPVAFARTLQEWKQAVTDRGHLPRYRVIGRLGQGSQGLVFGVADRDCLREVALKTLNTQSRAKDDISRFIHEAQITAQLEHPGIVPIHDLDVLPDGTVFYTMKKVEGHTLSDLVGDAHRPGQPPAADQPVRPSVHDLLQIMLKICDAVAFAHSRNVIHRDLKPRNVMVGRYGEVLVMDWGLAKVLDGQPDPHEHHRQVQSLRTVSDDDGNDIHQTMLGAAVGTPAYMSPEQARGEPADRRSDIYSLGIMLYRCLVGESPYDRGRIRYTLEQAVRGTWTRLDHRPAGRHLPKRLVAIVHTCMALAPGDRYQSADALASDLRSFLAGGTVSAYRETVVDHCFRIIQQQRRALLAAAGLLLVTGVGMALMQWRQGVEQGDQLSALRRSAVQHELMGEFDEARHDLERLLDQQPDDRDALDRLQRLRQAMARRADEVLAQRKRQEAAALARTAAKLTESGDDAGLRQAMESYLGALGLAPGDPAIIAAYRHTVGLIAQHEEAESQRLQATDRAQRAAELGQRAVDAESRGDLRVAISALEAALLLEPTDERTRKHATLIARQAELERVAEVRARQEEAASWIAQVRAALLRNDGTTAREGFDRARAADPDHPELPALGEAVQRVVQAAAVNEATALLAQADECQTEVRVLHGRLAEADPAAVPALRERRAVALGAALSQLHRAARIAPWLREPRSRLTSFYLDRLDEAEATGDIEGIAEELAEARSFDDGTQAAALAGLATVQVAADDAPLLLRRVGSSETLPVAPGAIVTIPAGTWIIGDVQRRLRRGELVQVDHPARPLPAGCLYVPGGTVEVAGELVTVSGLVLARDPVDPAELVAFRTTHGDQQTTSALVAAQAFVAWKAQRDGIAWRLPTVAERRLAGLPYAVPELALLNGGLCSLPDATHLRRDVSPTAVLRLAVE